MHNTDFGTIAAELGLRVAGHLFPSLSQIGSTGGMPPAPTRDFRLRYHAPDITKPSFFLIDVTVTDKGVIHLIEVNGSNAALSSSVRGEDHDRARHMAFCFNLKPRPATPVVALLGHQPGFIHIAEFYRRAGTFARVLSNDHAVALRGADEILGGEDVSIVCGPIAELAPLITCEAGFLLFRGRPVTFASNPNVLPELVRLGVIDRDGMTYGVRDDIFHEGDCTPLVHDKGIQQALAEGTAIAPLAWREAHDVETWMDATRWFREQGLVCVAKMNSGSGGAGIQVIAPTMGDLECKAALDQILAGARDKHGPDADATVFPVRLFQFAMASPYMLHGKPHLWDLRLQCLVSPGRVDVRPCVVRLCPAPFDGSYSWDSCVSNLTGRDATRAMAFLRAPGGDRRSVPTSVLAGMGMDERAMETVMQGCAEWSVAAARWAAHRQEATRHNPARG
jgi:hypothetical protein